MKNHKILRWSVFWCTLWSMFVEIDLCENRNILMTLDVDEIIRLKAVEQAAYDLVDAIETQEYKRTDYEQLKELIQYG